MYFVGEGENYTVIISANLIFCLFSFTLRTCVRTYVCNERAQMLLHVPRFRTQSIYVCAYRIESNNTRTVRTRAAVMCKFRCQS